MVIRARPDRGHIRNAGVGVADLNRRPLRPELSAQPAKAAAVRRSCTSEPRGRAR